MAFMKTLCVHQKAENLVSNVTIYNSSGLYSSKNPNTVLAGFTKRKPILIYKKYLHVR